MTYFGSSDRKLPIILFPTVCKSIIPEKTISILGPVEAPLFLLRGKYRYRILLKGKSRRSLNNFTRKMIKNCPSPSNLRIVIDVDPYTFLWFTHSYYKFTSYNPLWRTNWEFTLNFQYVNTIFQILDKI